MSEAIETPTAPADAKEVAGVDLTDAEKKLIVAVRNKRDAKNAARKFTGKHVKATVIRGRCCLFIAYADYTDFFGHTWQEAFMALVFRTKLAAESAKKEALRKSAESAKSVEVPSK